LWRNLAWTLSLSNGSLTKTLTNITYITLSKASLTKTLTTIKTELFPPQFFSRFGFSLLSTKISPLFFFFLAHKHPKIIIQQNFILKPKNSIFTNPKLTKKISQTLNHSSDKKISQFTSNLNQSSSQSKNESLQSSKSEPNLSIPNSKLFSKTNRKLSSSQNRTHLHGIAVIFTESHSSSRNRKSSSQSQNRLVSDSFVKVSILNFFPFSSLLIYVFNL